MGIACARPGSASCGEPIDIGSGNMFDRLDDYSTAGQNALAFSRYYNSIGGIGFTSAMSLGLNWRSTFDRYLHILNPSAIYGVNVERADGQVITFSSNSGTYTTDSDLDYGLSVSGSTWTLTDPDDTVETYSQTGGQAALQTIKLRDGYTQTMHYTGGLLTSVTDTYGRSLGLAYSSGNLTTLTTPDSETFTYGYSFTSGTRLTSVSYNTSPVTSQTYLYENASYPAALTGIIDENGNRFATWTYDGHGRAASSQLAGAVNFTSVSYDDTTGNRSVLGPLGILETYKFSTLQGVPKVTEIDRAANGTVAYASRSFSYDANGYVANETDWNGNNTSYVNNSHGLPTSITYASASTVAHTTGITYDTTWTRLPHIVTTPGLTTTLNYDSAGNLATQVLADTTTQSVPYSTNGQTRTFTYSYTSTGLLTSIKLPRTDVSAKTAFNYVGGALTFTSDALGHITTINTYKPGGLSTKITDPNGVQTTLAYSPRLWLTGTTLFTSAGNLVSSFTYDSAGNLTKTTLPDSSYLAYGYDAAHRLNAITNRLSESQGLTLDSAGNLTNALWKNASAVTKRQHSATYDALGRIRTDIGGMSQTTTYGYDSQGNATSIQSPLLNTGTQTFDALNRLKGITDAQLYFTSVSYDAHDRPTAIKDPKNNVTAYVYDGFGEPIQEVSPDRGTWVWHYDADGNVSSQTDGNGAVTNLTYDALDRPLTRSYPADSSLNVAFTYDQTSGHTYGIGRLTSLTDQTGSLSRSYEARGLVTSDIRSISSTNYTTGYSYESAGRLASITYASSGWLVSYARDNAGQVSAVTTTQPSHSAVNLATSVTHLPFGPIASLSWGNGITDTRTFDLDYRMIGVQDKNGASSIQYMSYGYDADDNLHTITDNVTTSNNLTVSYDAIDRMTQAGGNIFYDSNSNITQVGSVTNTVASNNNHITMSNGGVILYDSAGNVKQNNTDILTYSKANRLATYNGNAYRYDAFGHRIISVNSSVPTVEQYDQAGQLLNDIVNGTDTDYVYLDGMPLSLIQPATAAISALHTDRLGMVRVGTNASKTVVWMGNYAPYGAVGPSPASIPMNLRFPGQKADPTGLYNNGFRTYNPGNNDTYMQPDPIGLTGGLNPYIYARANPYKFIDPLGLETPSATFGLDPYAATPMLPGEAQFDEAVLGTAALAVLPELLPAEIGLAAAGTRGARLARVAGAGALVADAGAPAASIATGAECTVGTALTGGAQSALAGPALARQLLAEETAAAVFTPEGGLSEGAIEGSTRIIGSTKLGNPDLPPGLAKYSTGTYRSPSGDFQVHYYRSEATGEPYYGLDYKTLFRNGLGQ